MSSKSNKASFSSDIEESGWTMYFEDFFNNDNDHQIQKCSSLSSVASSSSLVSDAAFLAANKLADDTEEVQTKEEFSSVRKNSNRSSSFKNRKKTALVHDDLLEDTATSPLNTSMVLQANQLDKPKQKEEVDLSQEKGSSSSSGQRDRRKELGFNGRDSDCTELKKRGLCLVPLSMVLDHLG